MHDKKHADLQELETQNSSPSALCLKQGDLKIVVDDFPAEKPFKDSAKKRKEGMEAIRKKIEEIKTLTRKNKVVGDVHNYGNCHSCHGLLAKSYLIRCSEKQCERFFCLRCSHLKFHVAEKLLYEFQTSKAHTWLCFSCQEEEIEQEAPKSEKEVKAPHEKKENNKPFPKRGSADPGKLEKSDPKKVEKEPPKFEGQADSKQEVKSESKSDTPTPNTLAQPIKKGRGGWNRGLDKKRMAEVRAEAKLEKKNQAPVENRRQEPIKVGRQGREHWRANLKQQKTSDGEEEDEEEDDDEEKDEEDESSDQGDDENFAKPGGKTRRRGFRPSRKEACHYCSHIHQKENMAHCSNPECERAFCVFCIQEKFPREFDAGAYGGPLWDCYVCLKKCSCHKCVKPIYSAATIKRRAKRAAVPSNNRRRGRSKKMGETRMKFFDTISDDENEYSRGSGYYIHSRDLEEEEMESFRNSSCEKIDIKSNKFLKKKRRLKKGLTINGIDSSKILSEVNIDSTCFTLYDEENEAQLRKQTQKA